jgi:hypothetical protein
MKVDVDALGPIARENEVNAMPTFVIYKNGMKVEYISKLILILCYLISNLNCFYYLDR